jgi:hypothetical protein
VTLRTVTDDGNFFALNDRKVAVFVVINFHEIPLVYWPCQAVCS